MFGFIKNIFIRLLTSVFNVSNHAKRVLLNNWHCMLNLLLLINIF